VTSAPTADGRTDGAAPFDALLCDVDNVIRRYDGAALIRAEQEAGLAAGTTSQVAFAPDVVMPLLLGQVTPAQWSERIAEAFVLRHPQVPAATASALAGTLTGSPFAADPAVVAMLRAVRPRLTLVLVTNASVQLEADLLALGLADLAHHVVSSARVGVVKPDPRIYHAAADLAGAAPERCLFVDDTLANVEAARALGMSVVDYRTPNDLSAALGKLLSADRS
jgi:putative hydrolase of the HAD superfamily